MYEDFKDMVEDLQLVIPSTFEECFTYELQILYLKKLIDNIEPGGDYQEEIDTINRKLVTLQSEVSKLKNDVNNLNPDEVQRKLDAMQTEINGVKTSIQTITQNVTTLTGNVNKNTTDIETLTGEMTNVKNTLKNKQDKLSFDATPTAGSQNPVTSDGIKRALDNVDVGNVQEQLDAIKSEQTEQNKKISDNKTEIDSVKESVANQETDITALQETTSGHTTAIEGLQTGKQDKLTFDATPTAGSQNPVTSDGIKRAIDASAGGGGGGGGTGESDFVVKTLTSSLSLNLTNNRTITYELSPSGVVRHTDITISSISVSVGNNEKVLINLPKADNTFSHENLACYVKLTNIGGNYAQVPVKTKNTGVVTSIDAGPIIMDINNHLYIVFAFYNLIPIS